MTVMSALDFIAVNPNNVSTVGLVPGEYRVFFSDGTVYTGPGGNPSTNVAGTYMKMSSTGAISPLMPPAVTTEELQDAVGVFFSDTGIIDFTYDDNGNTISATVNTTALSPATSTTPGIMVAAQFKKLAAEVNVVIDFGADPTGATDSTAAFQNAANSLGAGGTVTVPEGRFKMATAGIGVINSNSHVRFKGAGKAETILFTTHPSASIITNSTGAWFSGCEGIGFDNGDPSTGGTAGYVTRTGGYAVDLADLPYGFVLNCDSNFINGVHSGGHLQEIDACNIRNFAQWASGVGILCDGPAVANDKYIRNVTMDSDAASVHASSSGIRVKQCASLRMANLNICHAGQTLDLFPDTGQVIPSVYAVNSFFDQGIYCLRLRGAGTIQRSKFTQCWFSGSGLAAGLTTNPTQYGVFMDSANAVGIDFVGCDIYGAYNWGIYAQPNGANELDWQALGCRISGNASGGVQTFAGAGHSWSLAANAIGQSGGFAANGAGVVVNAGTYRTYQALLNRALDRNTVQGIQDAGTATAGKNIDNNVGGLITGQLAANSAAVATSGTTETVMVVGTIPPNAMTVGTTFRIRLFGTTAASGNPRFRLRIGVNGSAADVLLATIGPVTSAAAASASVEMYAVIRSVGSGGTAVGLGSSAVGATNAQTSAVAPSAQTVNTTVQQKITLTADMSASVLTAHVVSIEVLKA